MSEQLRAGGETSAENERTANQLEILSEMSDQFDPDRARQFVEADKPEQKAGRSAGSQLEAFPNHPAKKPVSEMTKDEAAKAYDGILGRLSQDFVAGADERAKKEIAARIIDAEIVWQNAGENIKEIEKKLSSLKERENQMGLFKKLFTIGERRKARKQLLQEKGIASARTLAANKALRRELAFAYTGKKDFDYFGFADNHSYADRTSSNETYNQTFFNDKNMKDIATAMEIRLNAKDIRKKLTDRTIPHPSL